ncbi:MAG: tetraacyldisaccharide 4'-kinase [Rickettsiaceae bacterium]
MKLVYPQFWDRRKSILALILLPFTLIYFLCFWLRKYCVKTQRLPAYVICIGNITVGGSGKTQLVILLAKALKSLNISFAIMTKAYNSNLKGAVLVTKEHTSDQVGDESCMLLQYGTVIAASKIKYAHSIIESLNPRIIIVDDGMQNPSFHKDFTITTIDESRWFGNGYLVPSGPMREPATNALKKSNAIFLITSSLQLEKHEDIIENNPKYKRYLTNLNIPILQANITPNIKLDLSQEYVVFCGIGNPERFLVTLKNHGVKILYHEFFPDHHNYTKRDCRNLITIANQHNARLLTTSKDYVKLYQNIPDLISFDVILTCKNYKDFINLIYEAITKED